MASTTMTISGTIELYGIKAGGGTKYQNVTIDNSLIKNGTINSVQVKATVRETKRIAWARGTGYIGFLNASGGRETKYTINDIPRKNETAKTVTTNAFTPVKYNGAYTLFFGAKNNMATLNDIDVDFYGIEIYIDYTPPSYTITLNANGGTCPVSSITRYSGETYGTVTSEGDKPTKAGHTFYYWSTNADGTGRIYPTTTVTGNTTLYAQYTVNSYIISKEVSPSGSGDVTGAGIYEYGKSATLEAIPNAGYRFIKWNDNVTTNPRTITVAGKATYTAYFEKIPEYTVTINVSPSEGGTTTGAGIYYEGAVVTLTATPNKGYKFLYWRYIDEDGYSIIDKSPSTKHRIKGDLTFTAYFKKLALKIKSVKIYKHSKNEIASPDNPLMSGEEAIIEVKISYE